jgi:hypothetical protein
MSESPTPHIVNTMQPSMARVYDACLGGKDNYEVDRAVMERITQVLPQVRNFAWDNRNFLIRALRFIALQTGITQYLDCGSGLPTAENTHQVVQRINPESTVVYVDRDPVVLAHGRALLEENEHSHFVPGDIFDAPSVMENDEVRSYLDFSKPIALMHNGTLHHYDGDAAALMRAYVDYLPSGSYVAIAHFHDPENEYSPLAHQLEEAIRKSPLGTGRFRTRNEIAALMPGLELVPPGWELCARWWPDGPELNRPDDSANCQLGAVGKKP